MINVAICCFNNALATSIIGLSDLLTYCGVTWNYIHEQALTPKFEVKLLADTLEPVPCVNGIQLAPHLTYDEMPEPDVVIVPTIGGNILKSLSENPHIVAYLQKVHQGGGIVASNCTGAFFLAEAGLLEGREATTHWGFVDLFCSRYPNIQLKPEKMLTSSHSILCSAGGHACFDLGLYLIEKFYGHEEAIQSAKSFVLDMGRKQTSYSPLEASKNHQDKTVKHLQNLIEQDYDRDISVPMLAQNGELSQRTLIRRFKAATGDTPSAYLQAVRLEKARTMLENTDRRIADIIERVGYEDSSSFTRLFKRKTGLTPGLYRERYGTRFYSQEYDDPES